MLANILDVIDTYYKENLSEKRLVTDRTPMKFKWIYRSLIGVTVLLFYFSYIPESISPLIRVILFFFGVLIFIRAIKFRNKVELKVIRELEQEYMLYSKKSDEKKYWVRLNRIQMIKFLKFNEKELSISRKKLITFGEDIYKIHLDGFYVMKFPATLISILLSIEAIVLIFFDASKFSSDLRMQVIAGNGVILSLIIVTWVPLKNLMEGFFNSEKSRYKAIGQMLIGLKYINAKEFKKLSS